MSKSVKPRFVEVSAVTRHVTTPSPVVTVPKTLSVMDTKVRKAARQGIDYADFVPHGVVTPVRSFAPVPAKSGRGRKVSRINTDDELHVAWMGRAIALMFQIEGKLPGGRSRGFGVAWPISSKEADDTVIVRPAPATAGEIKFRDDVMLLVARVARGNPVGARIAAYHAQGTQWSELVKLDPEKRKRKQLDKVRKACLLEMVNIDRAEQLTITSRAAHMDGKQL
jgi:hypothetical protein